MVISLPILSGGTFVAYEYMANLNPACPSGWNSRRKKYTFFKWTLGYVLVSWLCGALGGDNLWRTEYFRPRESKTIPAGHQHQVLNVKRCPLCRLHMPTGWQGRPWGQGIQQKEGRPGLWCGQDISSWARRLGGSGGCTEMVFASISVPRESQGVPVSGRCCKISKCISSAYGLGVFETYFCAGSWDVWVCVWVP